jgi:hypothetical protein
MPDDQETLTMSITSHASMYHSLMYTATGIDYVCIEAEHPRVSNSIFWQGKELFLFSTDFRPSLGPPNLIWLKRPESEADHWPPSYA